MEVTLRSQCAVRREGRCIDCEQLTTPTRFFASFVGTIPALAYITFVSKGFSEVRTTLETMPEVLIPVVSMITILWFGLIWIQQGTELPSRFSYLVASGSWSSTLFGLGVSLGFLSPLAS